MIIVKSRLEKSFKCPFCGSDNQWIRRDFNKESSIWFIYVECAGCKARSGYETLKGEYPSKEDKEEVDSMAVANWDTRVNEPYIW